MLLIVGGLLGFLPILGFWMLPLGIALLSLDVALLRRPTARVIVAGERRWRLYRRSRRRNGKVLIRERSGSFDVQRAGPNPAAIYDLERPMKLFTCQHCGQLLYFENTGCERCGRALGFLPELATLSALEQEGELWQALAAPAGATGPAPTPSTTPATGSEGGRRGAGCASCQHSRTVPDLSVAENVAQWRKLRLAKNRLMYTILKLGLPHPTEDEARGLGFDFLADPPQPTGDADRVMTGHANG